VNSALRTISERLSKLVRREQASEPGDINVARAKPVFSSEQTTRRLELLLPFYWPEQRGEIQWCVSNSGKPEAQGTVDSLQELEDEYRQLQLWVYLDSGDVSILQTTLPNVSRKHLARAIPFALEDRLLGNIDEQFFTWKKTDSDSISVAVIGHDRMQAIVEALENEGLYAYSVSPVTLAAPMLENSWTLVFKTGGGWLRTGESTGMHCTDMGDQPPYALTKLLADARESDRAPTGLLIIDAPSQLDVKKWAADLGLEIFLPEGGLWDHIDRAKPATELLHDAYATKVRIQDSTRGRLIAISLIAILILGNSIAYGVNWFKAYRETSRLHQKMNIIFTQAFPEQANSVYDPAAQMQRNLDMLRQQRGGAGPNDFLNLLAPVSRSLAKLSIPSLDLLQYRGSELNLQVRVADYQKLDALVAELKTQGMLTEVKEASSGANGTQAKISVKRQTGTNP